MDVPSWWCDGCDDLNVDVDDTPIVCSCRKLMVPLEVWWNTIDKGHAMRTTQCMQCGAKSGEVRTTRTLHPLKRS